MKPGSVTRYHAHTYGNVVTVGLEGEVRVSNFEMAGERDFEARGTIKVRKTYDQMLAPDRINVVNLEHDYIRGFQAGPKGGRGLDITTRIKDKRPTPFMELSKKAADSETGIYEASWSG